MRACARIGVGRGEIALGIAVGSALIFNVSMALGAFMAHLDGFTLADLLPVDDAAGRTKSGTVRVVRRKSA